MKIQEYISKQPMFQKFKDRYFAPMAKYEKHVPETYMKGWLKTKPTAKEVSLYYIGVMNRRACEMPFILATLEKQGYCVNDTSVSFGIFDAESWESYYLHNVVEYMDERNAFLSTGKEEEHTNFKSSYVNL